MVLATVATVIASQAVISGRLFDDAAMHAARLPAAHDGAPHRATEEGQIYVPQVKSALAVGVLVLVFAFKTCDALAAAYGIAVTGTFICTCMLATVVFRRQFHWSRSAAIGVFGGFFVIDGVFFAANALKVRRRRLGAAGARRWR